MPLVAEPRITRTGFVAAAAAVLLSVLLVPLGEPGRTAIAAVLAVALIALGSPHGALDHLVLATGRSTRQGSGSRAVLDGLGVRFVVGYVGLALLCLLGYLAVPVVGFALFLVLSVAHFAAGEAGVALERGDATGWRDPLAWVAALGGVVVVVLPLASREAGAAVAAVDPRLTSVLEPLPALAGMVGLLITAALLWCTVAALRGEQRARTIALELATLTVLALLGHPLLAFGAYFAFWHSLRHQARLAQVLRPGDGEVSDQHVGRPLREVALSARAGLPATVGVLAVAVFLALGGTTVLGGLLAVIWALTVPHAVAVAVLEVRAARARRKAGGTVAALAASDGHDSTSGHDPHQHDPHQHDIGQREVPA